MQDNSMDDTHYQLEEKVGNELGLDLNKLIERIVNFSGYKETQEENHYWNINKNLKKISKVILMNSETEACLNKELKSKSSYFLDMLKNTFKEVLLGDINEDLDNDDSYDQKPLSKDLEFFNGEVTIDSYDRTLVIEKPSVKAVLTEHRQSGRKSKQIKARIIDYIHTTNMLSGKPLDKFLTNVEDNCKREFITITKNIRENTDSILDELENIPDELYRNLYLEICAFWIDARTTSTQFPNIDLQTVYEMLYNFQLDQNLIKSMLKKAYKDDVNEANDQSKS